MAELKPTLTEIKEELRIDFDADDALIQRYIDACAESVHSELHWAREDNPVIPLLPGRFILRNPIRLPVRGLDSDSATASIAYTTAAGEAATIQAGDDTFRLDNRIQANRYITWLTPRADWETVMPTPDYDILAELTCAAVNAPALVLAAIRMLTVDSYRNNGVGVMPMRTAVERMLNPIRDSM